MFRACKSLAGYAPTLTSPDRALIGPPPKMSWVKKVFFNERSVSILLAVLKKNGE